MEQYLSVILNQTLYFIIICFALLCGFCYYILTVKNQTDKRLKILVFTVSAILSIIVSLTVCKIIGMVFSTQTSAYKPVFSVFYTLFAFPFFIKLLEKTINKSFGFKDYVNPILVSIIIARFGCIVEGCCGCNLFIPHLEVLILTALLIYNIVTKKLKFSATCLLYALWRFVAEFFKDTYFFEKLGPFSLLQYMAGLMICLSIIYITQPKRRVKNE